MRYTIIILMLLANFNTLAQSNALASFINKFKSFKETSYAKMNWSTPTEAPESAVYATPMPNTVDVSKTFVTDPETGLRHYPHLRIVYDPATRYYIDYDAHVHYKYHIDARSSKIYKGETEVKLKRRKSD